jgi:hypothetical protein
MNAYSILAASLIPLGFLYIVKWLNLRDTSFQADPVWPWCGVCSPWSFRTWSTTRSGSLGISVHRDAHGAHGGRGVQVADSALSRASWKHDLLPDGAIYGFACGIGFAIAENMLYLSRVNVETGVVIATSRPSWRR